MALYPNSQPPGGALNHVGLRLRDSTQLIAIRHRLESAGIPTQRQEGVDLIFEKLGDIHCFQVDGVELRELRLSAAKPSTCCPSGSTVAILYQGPFAEIELDHGRVLRRGTIVELPEPIANRLTSGVAAESFSRIQVNAGI